MDAGDFLVLDVETSGGSMQNFPEGFRLLLTGTRQGTLYGMYTAEPASLAQLHSLVVNFDGPVVTFNGARFDITILDRWMRDALGLGLTVRQHYDLMIEIVQAAGRRISLDRLCYYTFGEEKVQWDHRQNARAWGRGPATAGRLQPRRPRPDARAVHARAARRAALPRRRDGGAAAAALSVIRR